MTNKMHHIADAELRRRLALGLVSRPPHRNRRRHHDHFGAVLVTLALGFIARLFRF